MKESDDLWRKVSSIEEGGVEGIEEPEKERNDNHHAIIYPQNHRFHIKYSLIVRDLSYHCIERDLYTLFDSLSSPNIRITIKRSPRDGRSLLHGFVDCKEEEERDALIERFHLHKFMGRRIKLEACDSNQQKMQAFDAHPSEYQVHVRYESLTSESHGRVTEEVLENECMRYGEIVDIVIKRHSETLGSGSMSSFVCNQRGYAFIYFCDVGGVRRAVASSPVILFNGKIRCDLSIPKMSNRTEDKLSHKEITVSSSFSSSSFHQHHPFPVSPPPPPLLPPPINTSNTMVVSPPVIYSVSPTHIQQSYSVIVTHVSPTASMTPVPVPYYPTSSPMMYYHPYHSPISQQIYPIGNNQIMDYYQSHPQNIGPFPVSTGRQASSSGESIIRNIDYQTQPLPNADYLHPSDPYVTPSLSSSNRDNSNYSETFVETQYEDIVRNVYDDLSTSTNSFQQQGGKRGLRNRRRSSQKHVNNMKSF